MDQPSGLCRVLVSTLQLLQILCTLLLLVGPKQPGQPELALSLHALLIFRSLLPHHAKLPRQLQH
jgi:hypothetical protein